MPAVKIEVIEDTIVIRDWKELEESQRDQVLRVLRMSQLDIQSSLKVKTPPRIKENLKVTYEVNIPECNQAALKEELQREIERECEEIKMDIKIE